MCQQNESIWQLGRFMTNTMLPTARDKDVPLPFKMLGYLENTRSKVRNIVRTSGHILESSVLL